MTAGGLTWRRWRDTTSRGRLSWFKLYNACATSRTSIAVWRPQSHVVHPTQCSPRPSQCWHAAPPRQQCEGLSSIGGAVGTRPRLWTKAVLHWASINLHLFGMHRALQQPLHLPSPPPPLPPVILYSESLHHSSRFRVMQSIQIPYINTSS